ncbi:MAG: hypothetical protein JO066_08420, partial [Verrucomicrobia bacterium]|nr:hypothetical protein [Verrucomicrobiota bacterium]
MSRRTFIVTAIVIGLSGVVLGIAFLQKGGQQKIAQRQRELEDGVGKVTEPMTTSIRCLRQHRDGSRGEEKQSVLKK